MVKYLDSNKSWVTLEVVSSNQGRIRLEMSKVATSLGSHNTVVQYLDSNTVA